MTASYGIYFKRANFFRNLVGRGSGINKSVTAGVFYNDLRAKRCFGLRAKVWRRRTYGPALMAAGPRKMI